MDLELKGKATFTSTDLTTNLYTVKQYLLWD
jgi:hypothetical protein